MGTLSQPSADFVTKQKTQSFTEFGSAHTCFLLTTLLLQPQLTWLKRPHKVKPSSLVSGCEASSQQHGHQSLHPQRTDSLTTLE